MIDLLIENGQVFNAFLKGFERKNVAIKDEKFYYITEEDLRYLEPTEILDAEGQYVVPGLIDIHMHIESSMIPPSTFSGAGLANGVTTVVADSHEIANVFGIEGIYEFMAQETVMDIFYAIPSSVPSTVPERETTGGVIDVTDVMALLQHSKVIALGEAMNFKGITSEPDSLIRQIVETVQTTKPFLPLEGHIPRVTDEDLAKFMFVGLNADHTHQSPESILEKVASGIFIELQRKSITPENISVINQRQLFEHVALITDDIMPDDLLVGHLNDNVRLSIAAGLSAEHAIYASTYTPARRMGFRDRGAIASGLKADFILLDDLESFEIGRVYKAGRLVHTKGDAMTFDADAGKFPDHFYQSVQGNELVAEDLKIPVAAGKTQVVCNVIQIQAVGTFTEQVQRVVSVKNGFLDWEASGLALIIVKERYGKNGNIGYGLVEGTFNKKGAVATTWAHDHHNLMVMGTSSEAILRAQSKVMALNGGYVVAQDDKVIAACPLPIGGILSDQPVPVVGEALRAVRQAMVALGYDNSNEIMSFSTLSLPVSPKIKITDFGMMDVHTHELIPLMEV